MLRSATFAVICSVGFAQTTPAPTPAAAWTAATCAAQTKQPACPANPAPGELCSVVHACNGGPGGTNEIVYNGAGPNGETGYTCCEVLASSSTICAGGSACRRDPSIPIPVSQAPTKAPTTKGSTYPFQCGPNVDVSSSLPYGTCGDQPKCYLGNCNGDTSDPNHGAVVQNFAGYKCCAYGSDAPDSTTKASCVGIGPGSVCTLWPTPSPTKLSTPAPTVPGASPSSAPTSASGGTGNNKSSKSSGLTGGDIAGIVIACLVVAALVVVGVMYASKPAESNNGMQMALMDDGKDYNKL